MKNGLAKAHNPADHKLMMEAIDKVGMLPPDLPSSLTPGLHAPPAQRARNGHRPPQCRWRLLQRLAGGAGEEECPAHGRRQALPHRGFRSHLGADLPINELSKPVVVGDKNARLGERETGKTVDNKLMTLHDFFKYHSANALYTV